MLNKCANPTCSAQFRYLQEGKLFRLSPTPEVEALADGALQSLYERFWLCEECSKTMTVVWDGLQAKAVELPTSNTLADDCDADLPRARPISHLRFADRDIR